MAASTAIIRLKRKRNENPLPTLYLDMEQTTTPPDTTKRVKIEHAPPSVFTLAMTMESDEYTTLDNLDVDLWKSQLDKRPDSSASDSSSKKRAFSQVHVSPPKFRMSRKRPRNNPPETPMPEQVQVFDAVRETRVQTDHGVPTIMSSGIPDEIQSGDASKDAILAEMLQSYLTVDADNRAYVNLKDEYVYDIYYRAATGPATVPTDANFGVLVYDSDPEMMEDEEVMNDEDADSNSEGYYQNSYPDEDEWAGEGWGSDEDQDEYGRQRKGKLAFDSDDDFGSESPEDGYSYSETE